MTTFIISIDRTALGMSPLVLSGVPDTNELGVTNYTEPARQARIVYAPSSPHMHGDRALAASWQQTLLAFDVVTDNATTEAESRALLETLRTAVSQFKYQVTVQTDDDAPLETWTCDMGSVGPIERNMVNLRDHNPIATVSLPCYPLPAIGA